MNEMESRQLRELFARWHDIDIGMYSYGCFDEKRIPRGTKIGRYCSFAKSATLFARDHGLNFLALHPYLYNSSLGVVDEDKLANTRFVVEDDVWIGHNAVILSKAQTIGRGAVIAAGAIVTQPVPRYAVVAGNPAKVLRFRFDAETIDKIEATKWWLKDKEALLQLVRQEPDLCYSPALTLEKK